MANRIQNRNKKKKPRPYLTKRVVLRAARPALRKASERAMKMMGYTIIAENGYLIRITADGKREKLSRLNGVKRPRKIVLE